MRCSRELSGEELEIGFLNKDNGYFKTLFRIDKSSESFILDRQIFIACYSNNLDLENIQDGLLMHCGYANFLNNIFNRSEIDSSWENILLNEYNVFKCNAFGSVTNFEINTYPTMEVNINLNSSDINFNKKETCYIYVNRENSTITILLSVLCGDTEAVEKIVIRRKNRSSGLFYMNVELGKFLNKKKYDIIQTDYLKSIVCDK